MSYRCEHGFKDAEGCKNCDGPTLIENLKFRLEQEQYVVVALAKNAAFWKAECEKLREALNGCDCTCLSGGKWAEPFICPKHIALAAHAKCVDERRFNGNP